MPNLFLCPFSNWRRFTDRIPQRIRDTSQAVDGEGLEGEEQDGDHEEDELPGLVEDAQGNNKGGGSGRRMRRFEKDHQASSKAEGEGSRDDARPADADGEGGTRRGEAGDEET